MEETTKQPEKRRRIPPICIAAVLLIGWLVYWICPFPNKFTFYELSDGTYAVSSYDASFPVAIFPASYWGKPVSQIHNGIYGLNDTRVAVVPDSVETLTRNVFAGNDKLKTVYLPDTLTMIGSAAFYNCPELNKIEIPQNVNRIGAWAFQQCPSLEQFTIPASVTEIGSTMPEDSFVTTEIFGDYFGEDESGQSYESIFLGCTALKEIIVEESNPSYCSVDGVLFTKDMTELLSYPAAKEGTSFTIPDTVTEIHAGAFADCVHLEEIILPERLTVIRDMTFYGCKALQKMEIPDTVTQIGMGAFYSCESLEHVDLPEGITEITEGVFAESGITELSLPESVTYIGKEAFEGCDRMEEVYLPTRITEIGVGAFRNCKSLRTVHVADDHPNYTSIDGVLFDKECERMILYPAGKDDISTYFMPWSVTSTEVNEFSCSKLRHVIYSPYLEEQSIGPHNCENMESITIPSQVANKVFPLASPNLNTCYDYVLSDEWTENRVQNPHHFMLALNGGWFNENWPEDKTLVKEGCTFLGWSTESCTDTDGAGALPEESGGKVYYAVFVEE